MQVIRVNKPLAVVGVVAVVEPLIIQPLVIMVDQAAAVMGVAVLE
jgi:hypothetical protein